MSIFYYPFWKIPFSSHLMIIWKFSNVTYRAIYSTRYIPFKSLKTFPIMQVYLQYFEHFQIISWYIFEDFTFVFNWFLYSTRYEPYNVTKWCRRKVSFDNLLRFPYQSYIDQEPIAFAIVLMYYLIDLIQMTIWESNSHAL